MVFEKLPAAENLKEDWFNQKIKTLTEENRTLEILLKTKSSEIARLDQQFRQKMVKHHFEITKFVI